MTAKNGSRVFWFSKTRKSSGKKNLESGVGENDEFFDDAAGDIIEARVGVSARGLDREEDEELPDASFIVSSDEEDNTSEEAVDESDEGIATDDPLLIYLRDIGKIPLFSHEKERAWGVAQVARRRRLAELKSQKQSAVSNVEGEEELRALEAEERAANEEMRIANLRLVVVIAKRSINRHEHCTWLPCFRMNPRCDSDRRRARGSSLTSSPPRVASSARSPRSSSEQSSQSA